VAIIFDSSIGGITSNSYISVADAAQYFENSNTADFENWQSIDDDTQMRALITATKYLDKNYKWSTGVITDVDQRLNWPRIGAFDLEQRSIDSDELPEAIQDACCELVLLQFDFSGVCPVDAKLKPEVGEHLKIEKLEGVGEIERFESASGNTRTFDHIDDLLLDFTNTDGEIFTFDRVRS
jgi:hypothetical protein